jgi:hypothetical protein
MPDEDLRWRLKMVAAQLDPTEGALDRWVGNAYSCWLGFYDAETKDGEEEDGQSQEPSERAQTFERADEAAPHYPMPILFDSRLRGLNLVAPDERPDWSFIEATFGRFLKDATARLLETTASEPQNEGGQ